MYTHTVKMPVMSHLYISMPFLNVHCVYIYMYMSKATMTATMTVFCMFCNFLLNYIRSYKMLKIRILKIVHAYLFVKLTFLHGAVRVNAL